MRTYIDQVSDWIELSAEMPSLAQIHRVTSPLGVFELIVAVGQGTARRQQREFDLQRWADEGGRV